MQKLEELKSYIEKILPQAHFDSVSVGIIDFKANSYETLSLGFEGNLYFDIASMTKPFTFGVACLEIEDQLTAEMKLLLVHRSGLPRWGRLDKKTWREQVLSYKISESETNYSDFGALRLQLEIEKVTGKHLYDISSKYWAEEVKHWLDLEGEHCAFTGRRNRHVIHGEVHDDNAFVIAEKVSHAGIFATIDGVCKSLLNINSKLELLKRVGIDHQGRYIKGFDSVENIETTLAGQNASKNTFGHLGFTGTSMWIDPEKQLGCVLLTNEVNGFWYDRSLLNDLRRKVGIVAFSK
ncbi:serine hydrolase [Bacteriovorax sp. Seq25_V]|uniref:serine hydrolase n=1 Tax=Bacteriovorax sp. Seq25_V TaxID=1201288 RepID=UPI00038A2809|nr:serine hydrolase [Bacteriovorax sp. Seq25_V]EQC44814.1 beta-lactamase [Bacteriovorax sp. Seq25_V]